MTTLALYRAATTLGGPLIHLYLAGRRARGKEDRVRFGERLGISGAPRPAGRLVWLHGASIGEAVSLLPIVVALRQRWPELGLLMTTGTVTSARLMARRLPAGVVHQYVPADRPSYVSRFLDHWRPQLAVWAESDFWPNLLTMAQGRGVAMVLVNGRISPRSFARWRRHPRTIARLLAGFSACFAQTAADGERLRQLGAADVCCRGNLKMAVGPLPIEAARLDELRRMIGGRPCWLAASTHAGEEAVAGEVHRELAADVPGLLTIIVPRHPQRGAEIVASLKASGLTVARRGAGDSVRHDTDIYLADTVGELGLFYRLAAVAFIGKSLAGVGGQNPLEAAHLDAAIVHGPHMDNFAEITTRLAAAGASETVESTPSLAAAVRRLLADDDLRRQRCRAAYGVATDAEGIVDAVVDAIAARLNDAERTPG